VAFFYQAIKNLGSVTDIVDFETSLVSAVSNLASGRLKILAITGPQRSPAVPNVPTVAESG
jgi:tripartite-type tricarboxylate transporter receptor subunit TctC